jgi:CheY-like chemotaxis protein
MSSAGSPALIIDDEPEYLQWVVEYLESSGLSTEFARNLPDGLAAIEARQYRLILVDLEVPAPGASEALAKARSPVIAKYPGIAAAIHARTQGYATSDVIVYSVHDDDAAEAELKRFDCPYVLKGRPHELKAMLKRILSRPVKRVAIPRQARRTKVRRSRKSLSGRRK